MQLDLFRDHLPAHDPLAAPAGLNGATLVDDILPAKGQLDLFHIRTVHLEAARTLVGRGDLQQALAVYDGLTARFCDEELAHEAAEICALSTRIHRVSTYVAVDVRANAYIALARECCSAGCSPTRLDGRFSAMPRHRALDELGRYLMTRAATELAGELGDHVALDGRFPGHYFLEAGELARAEASLQRAMDREVTARALYARADVEHVRGHLGVARTMYLRALLCDPFDAGLEWSLDDEIRGLPAVAASELAFGDRARAWYAPAGMVLGILPWIVVDIPLGACSADRSGSDADELGRAREFAVALGHAATSSDSTAVIAHRRRMKHLEPMLFSAYMDRLRAG